MFGFVISSLIALAASSLFSVALHAATPPRNVFIEVEPGVRIHALEAGSDRGKPALMLVPGWRLTAAVWDRQIDVFARERRVIAIDPRSQGQSTKTAEGNTPEQRARDLDKVLNNFKLDNVVLVGWSQGVQDVAAYIGQFGTGRLEGIVLVDTTVSAGATAIAAHPQLASRELSLMAIYSEDPKAYTQGMMHAIITRDLSADAFDHLVTQALLTPTAIGQAMLVADMFGKDRTATLAKFDRPTLVIASATSEELDAQKDMATTLPRGRIQVVEKAGHAVFIDQPEQFNALLGDFLRPL